MAMLDKVATIECLNKQPKILVGVGAGRHMTSLLIQPANGTILFAEPSCNFQERDPLVCSNPFVVVAHVSNVQALVDLWNSTYHSPVYF